MRPWVAPVGVTPGPIPPGPIPTDELEALRLAVATVGAQVAGLVGPLEQTAADVRAVAERTRAIDAAVSETRASLEEHREEARKVRQWALDWRNWVAVIGGVLAGLAAK